MSEPIRILHVFGRLGLGGAESRIIDLFRSIDRERVQFDFVVHYEADETGNRCPTSDELMAVRKADYFDEEVKKLGGNIYAVPRFKGLNLVEYRKAWARLFETHAGEWKAVQGHMTSTAAIYLPIAGEAGIPMTIAHARSAGTDPGLKGAMTRFIRRPLQDDGVCDYSFACTREAAKAVFGEAKVKEGKVTILPNAIEIDRFLFNPEKRTRIRTELGVNNAIVIGHVGRFHYAKNHEYLLRVFAEVLSAVQHKDAVFPEDDDFWEEDYALLRGMPIKLLLIGGGGALYDKTRELADELELTPHVIFAGAKSDVEDYYSAMDYFCFPSRYEGLPGTVIEAQAAGLQCLVSSAVTRDVDVTTLVSHRSIEDDPKLWARKIMDDLVLRSDSAEARRDEPFSLSADRRSNTDTIRERLCAAGFDVHTQARMMTDFYETGRFDE